MRSSAASRLIARAAVVWLALAFSAPAFADHTTEWEVKWSSHLIVVGTAFGATTDAAGNLYVVGASAYAEATYSIISKFKPSGDPDTAFGAGGGYLYTGGYGSTGTAVALDPAGNLYVLGETLVDAEHSKVLLLKYTPSGLPDGSFGDGGAVIFNYAEKAGSLALDSAGNIFIAASHATDLSGKDELIVAKFTPAGKLDSSFGGVGVNGVLAYAFEDAVRIAVNAADSLYVLSNAGGGFRLRRILPDGRRDIGFSGPSGAVVAGPFTGNDLALDASGRPYVLGPFPVFPATLGLLRYTFTGSVDGSFNAPGVGGTALALDASGKVYVAGDDTIGRLDSSGNLDTANFNSPTGTVTAGLSAGDGDAFVPANDDFQDVAVDASGNVFAVGSSLPAAVMPAVWSIVTYAPDGTKRQVASVRSGTAIKTPVIMGTLGAARVASVAVDGSGNPYVCGDFFNGRDRDIFIWKYSAAGNYGSGVPDPSFASGLVTYDGGAGIQDNCSDIAVNAAGNITVAGNTSSGVRLLRFTPSGSLDTSFSATGTRLFGGAGQYNVARIALDSAGSLYITGKANSLNNGDLFVAKFTSTGLDDTSFATGGVVTYNASGSGGTGSTDEGRGISVASNGAIFIAGKTTAFGATTGNAIALEYTPAGARNTDFGGEGFVNFVTGKDGIGEAVRIDSSGRILVAGTFPEVDGGNLDTLIIRYSPLGTYDVGFKTQGFTIQATTSARVNDLVLDAPGNMYVTGVDSDGKIFIAKFFPNGVLDRHFGIQGQITATSGFKGDSGGRLALSPRGESLYMVGTHANTKAWTIKTATDQFGSTPEAADGSKAYPNPLRPSKGYNTMYFSVPPSARVRIYTAAGELVKELRASPGGVARWDGTNQSGNKAGSDVYLALVEADSGKKLLTVAIQR